MLIRRRVRKGFLKEVRLVRVFSMRKKEVCRLDAGQSAAQHSPLKAKCSGAQGTLGLLLQRVGGNYRGRVEHSSL